MRRLPALVALALSALLAGCGDPPSDAQDLAVQDPQEPRPPAGVDVTAPEAPNTTAPAPGPGAPGAAPSATYAIDQANLSYEDAFVRLVLVADGDVFLQATWRAEVVPVTTQSACFAGSLLLEPERATGLHLAAWTAPANLALHARAAGQGVQQEPYPLPDQAAGLPGSFEGNLAAGMAPGERFVVDLGGSGPELFGWSDPNGRTASSRVDVVVAGPHHWETAPGGALACGVGAREAEGSTAGATAYAVDAEVGGEVAFDSTAASSAIVQPGFDLTGMNQMTVHFLGEESPLGPDTYVASAPEGGRMALRFDRSVESFAPTAWLFVDADWELGAAT